MLLISAGVIVALLLFGSIFFAATAINLSPFQDQRKEALNAVQTYINALNDYNATTTWNLMSPNVQAVYGTIQNFTDSFVSPLKEPGWHAQILANNFDYGTIAEYILVPFQNSGHITVVLGITSTNSPATSATFTFELKTYAYGHFQPSDWKIDNQFTIS